MEQKTQTEQKLYRLLVKKTPQSDWEAYGKDNPDWTFLDAVATAETKNKLVFSAQVVDLTTDKPVVWL